MPTLELTERELIVHLGFWEALAALQKSIRIPLAHIRGATDDEGFRGSVLGLRAPGTNLPGVISAGTYYRGGDKQFVFLTRGTHPLVIELKEESWARMVIGVADPRAMASKINAAATPTETPAAGGH